MAKLLDNSLDEQLYKESELFSKKLNSSMHFNLDLSGDLLDFSWLDEIEKACPFIDNVVRRPKLTLVREEITVKTEKSKKVNVSSVKDLARHTNYITKVDTAKSEVRPEKILDIRNEETYNIYENRFLYTLINNLNRFLMKKEDLLKNYEVENHKLLEYVGTTKTSNADVRIEVKLTSTETPEEEGDKKLEKTIEDVKERVKQIRIYVNSWYKSEMMKALEKANVPFVLPPIKKTNIFLKNPNFQVAMVLWNYLQTYGTDDEEQHKEVVDNSGDGNVIKFLDESFMFDYFILNSVSQKKREQKEKLCKVSVLMLTEQLDKTLRFLNANGYDLSEEELIGKLTKQMRETKKARLVGAEDVKKKFESAIDEYLERTQDYL